MPLAILLAAGWVRLLPMADMVSDLTHLLDVLEQAEEGDERPEHRSVRATFEQSWRLLSPAEQQLLMTLSVFAGSFTRTAVHDVSQAPLPVLGSLIDKSLVQIDGDARCSLHPLIQQFAAQKLDADPLQRAAARDQHAASYCAPDGTVRTLQFDRPDAPHCAPSLPNFRTYSSRGNGRSSRSARDWLQQCTSGLSNYFQARGPISLGIQLFARAEGALAGSGSVSSDAAWGVPLELAALNYWSGNYREVEAAGRRALARCASTRQRLRDSLQPEHSRPRAPATGSPAPRQIAFSRKRSSGPVPGSCPMKWRRLPAISSASGANWATTRPLSLWRKRRSRVTGRTGIGSAKSACTTSSACSCMRPASRGSAVDAFESGLRLAEGSGLEARRSILLTHCASALLDHGDIHRARELCREALQNAGGLGLRGCATDVSPHAGGHRVGRRQHRRGTVSS